MPVTTHRQSELPISLWPNGAGRKADIARGPGWLAAFAWLDADAPFSDYLGIDRTITLIDGDGFALVFSHTGAVTVSPRAPLRFDGGASVSCSLPHGACRVLNVMTQRDTWDHRVVIGPPTGCDADWSVYVALEPCAMSVAGEHIRLDRWDGVVIEGHHAASGVGDCVQLLISAKS